MVKPKQLKRVNKVSAICETRLVLNVDVINKRLKLFMKIILWNSLLNEWWNMFRGIEGVIDQYIPIKTDALPRPAMLEVGIMTVASS